MRKSRRPIDKNIKAIQQTVTTSNVTTTLFTGTYPGTVVGIRWSLNFISNTSASSPSVYWAIVIVRDGLSASTIGTSDGADFYTPESQVLAFGVGGVTDNDSGAGPYNSMMEGMTKTMRKIQAGDLLQFVTISNVATGLIARGAVQFFIKG